MSEVEIDDVASIGAIADVPGYQLAPEAWTQALNLRCRDYGLESLLGWTDVFGGTLDAGNDSFTKLLVQGDGVDAATTAPDTAAGGGPHTLTAVGNAQLDTSQKKFGASSLQFDGAGDRFTTPDAADLEAGSQNFVIDCFFNIAAATGTDLGFYGRAEPPFGNADISFWLRRLSTGFIQFLVSNGSAQIALTDNVLYTNTDNLGWHHAAGIRSGNNFYLAIDGVIKIGGTLTGSINNTAAAWAIGDVSSTGANQMNGWLDQVRFSIGTDRGWANGFTSPTREYMTSSDATPHFLLPISGISQNFWTYTSLTKAFVYDGTSHTNITRRASGVDVNYTANATEDWNGTIFGGIPIYNNNSDIPQFWSPQTIGTQLQNLTNWPSTLRARVIRAFGPFLVAINLTDNGTVLPHTVQWSHPATPGSLPSSWDYTNQTLDAGRRDFPDVQSGLLQDGLPLGPVMYLYKESSTWKMRFIGGRFIFDFGEAAWLTTSGILAPRCMCNTSDGTKQVVVTQDDIIWHNGNNVQSILDKRQRKRLFSELDTTSFGTSFIFDNPLFKEIWFCYPGSGQAQPDRALVMNYSHGDPWKVTEADGVTFRNAAVGGIESPNEELWDANEELWDDDTGSWTDLQRRRVLIASPDNRKIYNFDSGILRDAAAINTNLQRLAMSITGKKRDGSPIVDFAVRAMWDRIWPKVQGGPVSIRFGSQELVDGPVRWGQAAVFDPTVTRYACPEIISGFAQSLEISGAGVQWRIDGYKLNVTALGNY